MKKVSVSAGVTLIELLFVISFIVILSTFAVFSVAGVRSELALGYAVESFDEQDVLFSQELLTQKKKEVTCEFSLTESRSYFCQSLYAIPLSSLGYAASDLKITKTGGDYDIVYPSDISAGSISLSWTPADKLSNPKKTYFRARKGTSSFFTLPNDAFPPPNTSYIVSQIHNAQNYVFEILYPNKTFPVEDISFFYFGPANMGANTDNYVLLNKIEVLDFSDAWKPVDDLSVIYSQPYAKKRFFSSSQEYKSVKFSFVRENTTVQYQL